MRGFTAALSIALLATLAAGCGTTEPKRAVDARTEVLRFFPADAQVVALLRTDLSSGDQAALESAASDLPAWVRIQPRIRHQLGAAGLSFAALRPSLRPDEESPGPPELAVGAGSATDLLAGRELLVLATDHADRIARLFTDAADSGQLDPAGSYHEARLFRGPDGFFAVRDGVVVSAATLGQVQAALNTRDGDRDEHLNDGAVEQLLDQLPPDAPLQIYADPAAIGTDGPAARGLAGVAPWALGFDQLGAGLRGRGQAVLLDAFAKQGESSDAPAPPLGEAPTHFSLGQFQLPVGKAAASALRPATPFVASAVPMVGAATYSDGELRAHIVIDR